MPIFRYANVIAEARIELLGDGFWVSGGWPVIRQEQFDE
jgi:hypothetical protein